MAYSPRIFCTGGPLDGKEFALSELRELGYVMGDIRCGPLADIEFYMPHGAEGAERISVYRVSEARSEGSELTVSFAYTVGG